MRPCRKKGVSGPRAHSSALLTNRVLVNLPLADPAGKGRSQTGQAIVLQLNTFQMESNTTTNTLTNTDGVHAASRRRFVTRALRMRYAVHEVCGSRTRVSSRRVESSVYAAAQDACRTVMRLFTPLLNLFIKIP